MRRDDDNNHDDNHDDDDDDDDVDVEEEEEQRDEFGEEFYGPDSVGDSWKAQKYDFLEWAEEKETENGSKIKEELQSSGGQWRFDARKIDFYSHF